MRLRGRAGTWLAALVLAAAAVAAAEQALVELFPKPPARLVARAAADLDGDGQPETVVLYDTDLPGRFRLGLVREVDGQPTLPSALLKPILPEAEPRLVLRDLTGDGTGEVILTGGYGARGSAYQVLDLREGRWSLLLSLTDASPAHPFELDLDGDGQAEIIHVTGNHWLWAYIFRLTDWQLVPYRYTGERYEAAGWREPEAETARPATRELVALARGRLWDRAEVAALTAERASPEAACRWNRRLLQETAELFREQARQHRQNTDPEGRIAAAAALLLAGEFGSAASRLLTFAGPDDLPLGWQIPWEALKEVVAAAFEAAPDLVGTPAGRVVRGFVLLAAGDRVAARLAFLRARTDWPEPGRLEAWIKVGLPGARLYYLGSGDILQRVELAADGQRLGQPVTYPQLGPLRSVAASPVRAVVALVNAAGDRVSLMASDGKVRELLTGEFFSLAPHAVSPDGRFLVVEQGVAAVRRLLLVDLPTGRVRATVTCAGHYRWAPDARSLAVVVPAPAEPPLPWFDGGTRHISLIGLDGQELRRLALGDATCVWDLEAWHLPDRLDALATRYGPDPLTGEVTEQGVERYVIIPATGQQLRSSSRSLQAADTALLEARLQLPASRFELAWEAGHPRFILYRQQTGPRTELFVLRRDGEATPVRLGPAPPLTDELVASWGGLDTETP